MALIANNSSCIRLYYMGHRTFVGALEEYHHGQGTTTQQGSKETTRQDPEGKEGRQAEQEARF
ncbi:MAG: hypothetical protein Q8J96_11165 [Rhodocyclaceae bacterium]|nr:hypothetical protein [Rhodocyclaceae bacterium]